MKNFFNLICFVLLIFGAEMTALSAGIDQVKQLENLQNAQETDKRFADYYEKLKQSPKDLNLHLELGKLYAEKQLYELSLMTFRRALEINPQYSEAHYQMSLVYRRLKMKLLELRELQQAVQKAPQGDKYHYYLGVLYMEKTHYDYKLAKVQYKILKKQGSPFAQKLGKLMGLEE